MKNFKIPQSISFFLPFSVIVCLDQLTKLWARGQGIVVINQGVSFGFGSKGSVWFFVLLTIFILAALFSLFKEIWKKNFFVYGLLCGAAISNVIDRIWWGGVQDFLPLKLLRLQNNVADWVIFGCMAWIGWQLLFSRERR